MLPKYIAPIELALVSCLKVAWGKNFIEPSYFLRILDRFLALISPSSIYLAYSS